MKINSYKTDGKFSRPTFGLLLLLIAICPHRVVAQTQTNTYPLSGNVGIGTMTPAAKLEISGDNPLPRVTNTNASSYGGLELFEGGTLKFGLHTLGSSSGSSFIGGANAVQIWNYANGPMVFGTNSNERMRINANGNVGLGTTDIEAWTGATSVIESLNSSLFFGQVTDVHLVSNAYNQNGWKYKSNGVAANYYLYNGTHSWRVASSGTADTAITWIDAMTIGNSGKVGIGTTTPGYSLDVQANAQWVARFKKTDATHGGILVDAAAGYNPNIALSVNGAIKWYMNSNTGNGDTLQFWESTGATPRFTLTQSGTVGIGTPTPSSSYKLDVNGAINASGNINSAGNITATGSISAKYQDVAEWVESSQYLPAGTVVVLDQTRSNQVIASSHPYDTRVAGVVSAQPGITLGEKGESKVLVATTGRVKVMVDASSGPVQVGDLLVTSDIAGVARKSEPLLLGSVPIHRPGTLIGKALEPLAKGRGEILVLLSLQ